MKKTIFLLVVGFLSSFGNCQEIAVNYRLGLQLGRNQVVRVVSANRFTSEFEEQNELYDRINDQANTVVMVHNYIYNNLKQLNTNISQGKKVYYILENASHVIGNINELRRRSTEYPVIAGTLHQYYQHIYTETMEIYTILNETALRDEEGHLMDSYDRDVLLDKIYSKVKTINASLQYLVVLIDAYKNVPLLGHMPIIGDYYLYDMQIVETIMLRYNWIRR